MDSGVTCAVTLCRGRSITLSNLQQSNLQPQGFDVLLGKTNGLLKKCHIRTVHGDISMGYLYQL